MRLTMISPRTIARSSLVLALLTEVAAFAQTAPNAGSVLQEQLRPRLEVPRPSPDTAIEAPKPVETLPGGGQLVLKLVRFHGNSLFSESDLRAALGDVQGKSYDLAGLRALAERAADVYHAKGYPFARAYLPPQALQDGDLLIEVVEGRYGQVTAMGEPELARGGQAFLSGLRSGAVIESATLERATLVLADQPGIKAAPVIRPGQAVGTGDLDVLVQRTERVSGDVGLDNYGNRYTGAARLSANLALNSPFLFGDQITASALGSEGGLWLGSLGYSLPLGVPGLRGQVGYSHTYYTLGQDFASLGATGTADVSSLGASYPLVRSQAANLSLSGSLMHKDLNDKQDSTGTSNNKSSDSLPLTLGFDVRDALGGGGLNYGNLIWTSGTLRLDSTLASTDANSANTQGYYDKFNLELARIQALPAGLSGFAHLSAQASSKNLDSSERFSLGGATGVRAYPVGEASGDEGWMAQLELRYAMQSFNPYLFYDGGTVTVNRSPWTTGTNQRTLSGGGVGVRYQSGPVNVALALAWRNEGGKPQSDTQDNSPQAWLSLNYKF